MLRFRRTQGLQKFAAVHSSVYGHFHRSASSQAGLVSKPGATPLLESGVNSAPPDAGRVWTDKDWFVYVLQHLLA